MHAGDDLPIRSTALGFDVLEAVHDLGEATLPEVVDGFAMPESTVHDHLTTLTRMGYLVNEGGTYRFSLRFLTLGGRVRSRSRFFEAVEPTVHELAPETGEHATLVVEEHGPGVFLSRVSGSESINLDTYEGMAVSLHTTAMGKAVLAESPPADPDASIDTGSRRSRRPRSATRRDSRRNSTGSASATVPSTTRNACPGSAVSPRRSRGGDGVAGALSVSEPRRRMSDDWFEETVPVEVVRTANVVELTLQHGRAAV